SFVWVEDHDLTAFFPHRQMLAAPLGRSPSDGSQPAYSGLIIPCAFWKASATWVLNSNSTIGSKKNFAFQRNRGQRPLTSAPKKPKSYEVIFARPFWIV